MRFISLSLSNNQAKLVLMEKWLKNQKFTHGRLCKFGTTLFSCPSPFGTNPGVVA
jgi:hypothetical protein